MAAETSVTIVKHFFRIKGDLTKFVREMVALYQIGDFLNAEDMQFCLSLFESHKDYPQKLEPGVQRIQLLVQKKGSLGFQLHKTDGSSDDISWTDCVANRK
jgi:hypothetical protein